MSDTFDHEGDAWGSLDQAIEEGFQWGSRRRQGKQTFSQTFFCRDPLHYHTKVRFNTLEAETKKAYLLRLSSAKGVWVPKSVCRHMNPEVGSVFVHAATYSQCRKVDLSPVFDGFEVLD